MVRHRIRGDSALGVVWHRLRPAGKSGMIRKISAGQWRLYSHKGRNLGTFRSLKAAKRHERLVNFIKSGKARLSRKR
jgi:hypothetical protein